jgi:hypothetical protein
MAIQDQRKLIVCVPTMVKMVAQWRLATESMDFLLILTKNVSVNSSIAEDQVDNDDAKSSKGIDSFGLTKDQYEKLVNLLQTATTTHGASTSAQVNAISL